MPPTISLWLDKIKLNYIRWCHWPFPHDAWVKVGVDEVGVVGKPTHAEDGDHKSKHLHYLKNLDLNVLQGFPTPMKGEILISIYCVLSVRLKSPNTAITAILKWGYTRANATLPVDKIHPFSKIAVTFDLIQQFWCPSAFNITKKNVNIVCFMTDGTVF